MMYPRSKKGYPFVAAQHLGGGVLIREVSCVGHLHNNAAVITAMRLYQYNS